MIRSMRLEILQVGFSHCHSGVWSVGTYLGSLES